MHNLPPLLALSCASSPSDKPGTAETGDTLPDETDTPAPETADTGTQPPTGDTGSLPPTYTPVLIDFDELTEQVEVDQRYAEHVVFEVADGYHLFSWNAPPIAPSPPFAAYTTDRPLGAGQAVDISLVFARPVRALRFLTFADDTAGPLAQVRVLTEDGLEAQAEIVGDAGQVTAEQTDLSAHIDIVRVDIHDIIDDASVAFDDLSFEIRDE